MTFQFFTIITFFLIAMVTWHGYLQVVFMLRHRRHIGGPKQKIPYLYTRNYTLHRCYLSL